MGRCDRSLLPILGLMLTALGCGPGSEEAPSGTGQGPDLAAASIPFSLPTDGSPAEGDFSEVMRWLLDGRYGGWESETDVHTSSQGPNGVRVFLSPSLVDSLAAGSGEHPVGAIAVRELYAEDLELRHGFALALKAGDSASDAAQNWFWLQVFGLDEDSRPVIAAHGARGCVKCHQEGADFIRSSYPLP